MEALVSTLLVTYISMVKRLVEDFSGQVAIPKHSGPGYVLDLRKKYSSNSVKTSAKMVRMSK
jgi:hypothetical protein